MAFRNNEAAQSGYERAKNYLIHRDFTDKERIAAENKLLDLIDALGPVVDSYPTWHPLVCNHDSMHPVWRPGEGCGYEGLDHTINFAHGVVTCPYTDGSKVIDSVQNLPEHHCAYITAEKLDVKFYAGDTTAILVRCDWSKPLDLGKMIPKSLAVPLMLEQELPCWRKATRAEKWETMRPYFLGQPHGSRSSLFVEQHTALAMKKAYLSMVESGMFGPLKMD